MSRSVTFEPGEWYHCFNLGIDNRTLFMDRSDFVRFQKLLYAANSTSPVARNGLSSTGSQDATRVFTRARETQLVDIGAYTLIPTRYHLLMRERTKGSISAFMHRINTAFTMYFNTKHRRGGTLFSGRFKALHVPNKDYLERVTNYIHGHAIELFEKDIDPNDMRREKKLIDHITSYEFASLYDYQNPLRYESAILSRALLDETLNEPVSTHRIIKDFKTLYSRSNMRDWMQR